MDNLIENKTFDFSVRIVNLYKYLTCDKNEYIMSKQLLRCGTSIGANVAESQNAQSNNDFITKLTIAIKETAETKYWLRLLNKTDYLSETEFVSIYEDCCEIYKIISSIIITSKDKQQN